jgi:hypothetical protein
MLQGTLESGALISAHLQGGKAFPDTPGLGLRIDGKNGGIRDVAPGVFPHMGFPETKITIHDMTQEMFRLWNLKRMNSMHYCKP